MHGTDARVHESVSVLYRNLFFFLRFSNGAFLAILGKPRGRWPRSRWWHLPLSSASKYSIRW